MKRARGPSYYVLALLVGCIDSTAPPRPCDGDIGLIAITTTPVRFGWSPACGVSSLTVTTVEASPVDERVVWGWTVPEQEPVGPTIIYGANPRDAAVWAPAEPLDVGTEYRVTVMHTVGGDVVVASGTTTFTWFPPD